MTPIESTKSIVEEVGGGQGEVSPDQMAAINDVETIAAWYRTAPRGEPARAAREMNISPQAMSKTCRWAQYNRRTSHTRPLAWWIINRQPGLPANTDWRTIMVVARVLTYQPRARVRIVDVMRAINGALPTMTHDDALEIIATAFPVVRDMFTREWFILDYVLSQEVPNAA